MPGPEFSLGISPCPNDTYIFEALIHGRVDAPFRVRTHMADVEELNSRARSGALDITKLSLAAMAAVAGRYQILNAGAALGRGCGPLLIRRADFPPEKCPTAEIAIPGRMTTANLLLSLNGEYTGPRKEMVFDRIMPALAEGRADLGLIIHEGRFTYREHGFDLVLDLGDWWEKSTGLPLPLGLIAVRRELGTDVARQVQNAIRASLAHAGTHPKDGQAFIRAHAQEMDPAVMAAHIRTFVNEFSVNLGSEGQNAVRALLGAAARESGQPLPDLPLFTKNEEYA